MRQGRKPEAELSNSFTPPSMHYVYVLQRKDGNLYIGYSHNLRRRIMEHQRENESLLLYYEAYLSEQLARDRERKLKYYGSALRALKKRLGA